MNAAAHGQISMITHNRSRRKSCKDRRKSSQKVAAETGGTKSDRDESVVVQNESEDLPAATTGIQEEVTSSAVEDVATTVNKSAVANEQAGGRQPATQLDVAHILKLIHEHGEDIRNWPLAVRSCLDPATTITLPICSRGPKEPTADVAVPKWPLMVISPLVQLCL